MNTLLIISMLAFTMLTQAAEEDFKKICTWKPEVSNGSGAQATAQKNRNIYEWHNSLEELVNLQIRLELMAFYNYLNMARFFQRYDQDRQGFAKYFRNAASEELEHSEMFMKYQQMRGGKIKMKSLPAPESGWENGWENALDVFNSAFDLEEKVTKEILCLHTKAKEDVDFQNFLEEKIIPEQYESMKEIKTHIKNLERACPRDAQQKFTKCPEYPVYELQYERKLKVEK